MTQGTLDTLHAVAKLGTVGVLAALLFLLTRWARRAGGTPPTSEQCAVPPRGWSCSRVPGHAGPCAARRVYSWRFPVWLALAGVVVGAFFDLACPRVAEPAEPTPVKISANPMVGFGPLPVRIRAVVANHPDNVMMCIWVDGPLRFTSSCHPHTSQSLSERTLTITLPEGEYLIWAEIHRTENRSYSSGAIEVSVR
jgi:hypothetical protein